MDFIVNGQSIPLEYVTFRNLGFDQKTGDRAILNYLLVFETTKFIEIMEKPFNDFVKESKLDDHLTDNADTLGLFEMGYPSFFEVFEQNKNFLEQFIKRFLFLEFLEGCFTGRQKENWRYVVNSMDSIVITGKNVLVTGDVYCI